jgi:hypothetical protein
LGQRNRDERPVRIAAPENTIEPPQSGILMDELVEPAFHFGNIIDMRVAV